MGRSRFCLSLKQPILCPSSLFASLVGAAAELATGWIGLEVKFEHIDWGWRESGDVNGAGDGRNEEPNSVNGMETLHSNEKHRSIRRLRKGRPIMEPSSVWMLVTAFKKQISMVPTKMKFRGIVYVWNPCTFLVPCNYKNLKKRLMSHGPSVVYYGP